MAYLTQTTLSVDDAEVIIAALKRRFPHIVGPSRDDICYATQNRQEAVKELVPEADAVIVLGSQNSSNSMRLAELARTHGKPAYLIDSIRDLPDRRLHGRGNGAHHGRRQRPGGDGARVRRNLARSFRRRASRPAPSARNTSASPCRASCACWRPATPDRFIAHGLFFSESIVPDTPISLLERLRLRPNEESWRRLVDLYTPLIRHNAVRIAKTRVLSRFREEIDGILD